MVKSEAMPIAIDTWSLDYQYRDDGTTAQVLAYFIADGKLQPAKLPPMPLSDRMGTAALGALLSGPSEQQRAEGLSTKLPGGLQAERLQYDAERSMALLTLSESLLKGDAVPFGLELAQLVFTLTQFPSVDYVQLLDSEGKSLVIDSPSGYKDWVCRADFDRSAGSITPPPAARRTLGPGKVTTNCAVVLAEMGAQPRGGMTELTVEVAPAGRTEAGVEISEGETGATGAIWEACCRVAALAAASALGVEPSTYRIVYSTGGPADAPGCEAAATLATMAALLGDAPRTDTTVLGTVNPDLTIGPVTGAPQRLEAAAQAGKKLVLIPAGQTEDVDLASGASVQLEARAAELGLTLQEVVDVYEAYGYATGVELARPVAGEVTPTLPEATHDKLEEITRGRLESARAYAKRYADLGAEVKDDYTDKLIASSQEADNDANARAQAGDAGVAYARAKRRGVRRGSRVDLGDGESCVARHRAGDPLRPARCVLDQAHRRVTDNGRTSSLPVGGLGRLLAGHEPSDAAEQLYTTLSSEAGPPRATWPSSTARQPSVSGAARTTT